jgi:phage shock protein E
MEQTTDLSQVKQDLEKGQAILLDVRERDEWNKDRLKNSQLSPLTEMTENGIPTDLPKDKTIYTHCMKGGRAQQAAKMLENHYENVVPLKCKFEELKQAGL